MQSHAHLAIGLFALGVLLLTLTLPYLQLEPAVSTTASAWSSPIYSTDADQMISVVRAFVPQAAGHFGAFEPICQVTFGKAECMQGGHGVQCPKKPQEGAVPSATGAWNLSLASYTYFMDRGLVAALTTLFAGQAVLELGAGKGCYAAYLRSHGLSVRAFDGAPGIGTQTRGLVHRADLTSPLHVARADWVLCLETAEHIPREFEETLLRNILEHARVGVVLSWSNHGGGNGHVNLHTNEWVVDAMAARGFDWDEPTQRTLRGAVSHIHWFRDTVMAFRRRGVGGGGGRGAARGEPPPVVRGPELGNLAMLGGRST